MPLKPLLLTLFVCLPDAFTTTTLVPLRSVHWTYSRSFYAAAVMCFIVSSSIHRKKHRLFSGPSQFTTEVFLCQHRQKQKPPFGGSCFSSFRSEWVMSVTHSIIYSLQHFVKHQEKFLFAVHRIY